MQFTRLRKATNTQRCYWSKNCRKWVKFWCSENRHYYCGKHKKKLQKKEVSKKRMASTCKSMRAKRKVVTARVLKLRENATWAEKIFKDKMRVACPVKFQFQRGFIKGGYFAIVDFYLPSRKLCIEIDGEYHNSPEQRRKDRHRDNWLRTARKMKVVRITNKQAIDMSIEDVKQLFINLCQK